MRRGDKTSLLRSWPDLGSTAAVSIIYIFTEVHPFPCTLLQLMFHTQRENSTINVTVDTRARRTPLLQPHRVVMVPAMIKQPPRVGMVPATINSLRAYGDV